MSEEKFEQYSERIRAKWNEALKKGTGVPLVSITKGELEELRSTVNLLQIIQFQWREMNEVWQELFDEGEIVLGDYNIVATKIEKDDEENTDEKVAEEGVQEQQKV